VISFVKYLFDFGDSRRIRAWRREPSDCTTKNFDPIEGGPGRDANCAVRKKDAITFCKSGSREYKNAEVDKNV